MWLLCRGSLQIPPRRAGLGAKAVQPLSRANVPSHAAPPVRGHLSRALTFPQGPSRILHDLRASAQRGTFAAAAGSEDSRAPARSSCPKFNF